MSRQRTIALGLIPLVLLGALVLLFFATDPLESVRRDSPPVEELTINSARLEESPPNVILSVTNGGPDPVTVAQVLVDDAYWRFGITGSNEIGRLETATIDIPYPWVEGEAHEIALVTSTGVTFTHEIEVAIESPQVTGRMLLTFTLMGIFVGVIPVALGLGWLPFLRGLDRRWMHFFLALTAGLLVFLAVDALDEALELADQVPGAFQGTGLVVLGVVAALAAINAVDGWLRQKRTGLSPLYIAMLIALGIGFHNMGEGLAIGAAFALGEVGLTSFLILGFTLHNVTEGLGIVAPLAEERPTLWQLAGLGLLAGAPTIAGTWIGGLSYSPTTALLFLSIGAGAIVQVVWEIAKLLRAQATEIVTGRNAIGFALGVVVMYATGLAVTA